MPFGPSLIGVAYFSGIKIAGYSLAGRYVNRRENLEEPNPIEFGVARALMGVAAGMSYGYALAKVHVANTEWLFYAGLLPVRLAEWAAILWLFYRAVPAVRNRRREYILRGIGWSYVLDIPAVLAAFALPGGFWIC